MTSQSYIPNIIDWLRQLAIHNDRNWFKSHKEQYDALRKPWEADMERLISLVSDYDAQARGLMVRDCVYRIYRDIRFSHDKSPYKTYFSGVIGKGGRHTVQSCYYVHFQPDNIMLCGGIWWPERDILNNLRHLIDAEGDEFLSIVSDPTITEHYRWESETLKTMPKGFASDHPLAQFLKMKEYILVRHLDEDYFHCDDWVARVATDLSPLKPLHDFLNFVIE